MTYQIFLETIQTLSSNSNKLIDSTLILKSLPKFNKEELYNIATDLHEQGMIKMQTVGKHFQAELTSEGVVYLNLLKIF